jgi:hypothetical protein
MNRKPTILHYTWLPTPGSAKRPPKRIFFIVGWCVATTPFLTFSLLGTVNCLSNIIAPTRTYDFGDVHVTVMTPGRMISFVKLVFIAAVGVLAVLVLIRGIKKAFRDVNE